MEINLLILFCEYYFVVRIYYFEINSSMLFQACILINRINVLFLVFIYNVNIHVDMSILFQDIDIHILLIHEYNSKRANLL